MATEEDKKLAKSWKDGADGILIFVRRSRLSEIFIYANPRVIDWVVLCCSRVVDLGVHSGPPAGSTGHLQLLPR